MTGCPCWGNVDFAHHASLEQLPSCLPWVPIGMFMLWLLSGKCWALSGICTEILFPARSNLMSHLPACLGSTLWMLSMNTTQVQWNYWKCSDVWSKPIKTRYVGNAQPLEHHLSIVIKHTILRPALGPLSLVKVKYLPDGSGNVFQRQWQKPSNYLLEILLRSNMKEFMFVSWKAKW